MSERPYLIDVSRLIWRVWTGRLPTGIDRVCLAYLEHFGARAQAVVQKCGFHLIVSPKHSDRLFTLLRTGGPEFKGKLLRMPPAMLLKHAASGGCAGKIYLNIGHTGLNEPTLPYWVKRNRLKAVYLIHDLIPIANPEFCREGEAEKHAQRMRNVLKSASGIIGNSQSTLDELAAFAKANGLSMPARIAAWISGYPIPETAPQAGMDRPYFVTVGTIEGRKNHILLLQLWRQLVLRLGSKAPRLIIVGQRGWEAEHALAMLDRCDILRGHVREMARCDDDALARLVKGARAVLMPSFAEGFGLPVVEALQLGTPVIASDLPVFREIAGDIPTYLSPIDGIGWEQAILGFLGDSPERQRQIADMAGFTASGWPSHFAQVESWLKTL